MDPRSIARADWDGARASSAIIAKAWRRTPEWRALADAFDDRAADSLAIARDRATALLADAHWVARLLTPLTTALAANPLFEPPLKVARERGRIGAVLFDAPAARVTISIVSADELARHPASSVVVPGHVSVTRYMQSGGSTLRRWRADATRIDEVTPLRLRDGDIVVHDGRCEGQVITDAAGDVAMLTIILRTAAASTMRAFAIADGALLRTASNDDGASRTAMLLTLLRVSGRADAGQVFDAATRDPAPSARWSAMREWLALDAMAASPRLAEMAGDDPDPAVRAVATGTVALVERRRAACRA